MGLSQPGVDERWKAGPATMTTVRLRSPAKINWTMDVLGKRNDGYHEVRTILQTIALSDTVTVSPADDIEIVVTGETGDLLDQPQEDNLAYQAASALREDAGISFGARIELHKRIPVATGLGGGSSNAAATLRALRTIWRLSLTDADLARIGTQLGSDVPFFLTGGTALGSARGDEITPLSDVAKQRLVVAWSSDAQPDKTTKMYSALESSDFVDDATSARFIKSLERGAVLGDADLSNVFDSVVNRVDPAAGQALADAHAFGTPHLAGSGPAFFLLLAPTAAPEPMVKGLAKTGLTTIETHTISASEALEPA